ncbi:MAG: hypothetical protein QOG20_5352, partial [Pseudonocardiales bacterium]|nr:hypothetical protein [Pseudonocardiales bacterium]
MTTPKETIAEVRTDVRRFLAEELAAASFRPTCDSWIQGHSATFSRKL